MKQPLYTPYDGSAKLFTIGLTQLDPTEWIEPDHDLGRYLSEKTRLLETVPDQIFVAEADTQDSQDELLALLADYLPERFPAIYHRSGAVIRTAGRDIDLADPTMPPLIRAGSLIQDDLVIMRRRQTGWHLAAGYVAFPSSWSLQEKFGLSMDQIHGVVPGFEGGTRNADLINRMFDNLPPGRIVRRFNWSINPDAELHYPKSKTEAALPSAAPVTLTDTFARVERQTLRRLPGTGDIVFTIRIYTDPLSMLETYSDAARIATAFADQLEELTLPQASYKGFVGKRKDLVAALRRVAAG